MSALRSFNPRRNRPVEHPTPPKAPNPPKVAVSAEPGLDALAALGADNPVCEPYPTQALGALVALGASTDGREHEAVVADIIRRAGNAFSPDVMADEAELCIRETLS